MISKFMWYPHKLTDAEIAGIATGAIGVYFYGRIEYRDAFKVRHTTHYRFGYWGIWPPPQGAVLNFCKSGNTAD